MDNHLQLFKWEIPHKQILKEKETQNSNKNTRNKFRVLSLFGFYYLLILLRRGPLFCRLTDILLPSFRDQQISNSSVTLASMTYLFFGGGDLFLLTYWYPPLSLRDQQISKSSQPLWFLLLTYSMEEGTPFCWLTDILLPPFRDQQISNSSQSLWLL